MPLFFRDEVEFVGGIVVEFEEEIGFPTHYDEFTWSIDGNRVKQTMKPGVIGGCFGVACRGHDSDSYALGHERENPRNHGIGRTEILTIFVEGHVSVESDEGEIWGGGVGGERVFGQGHALGCVKDDANVVEGRGNESAGGDAAEVILVGEGG